MKRKDAERMRRKALCIAIIAIFFVNSFGNAVYAQIRLLGSGTKNKFSSIEEFFNYTAGISADQQFQLINSSSVVCTKNSVKLFTDASAGKSAYKFTCFANDIQDTNMQLSISILNTQSEKDDFDFLGYVSSNETAITFDGYGDSRSSIKFFLIPSSRAVFNVIIYTSAQSPQLDATTNIGKVISIDNFDDFKQFLTTLHNIESLVFLKHAYEQINNVTAAVSYSVTNIQTSDSSVNSLLSSLSSSEIFELLSSNGQAMQKDTASGTYYLMYDSSVNKIFVQSSNFASSNASMSNVGSADVTLSFVPLELPQLQPVADNTTQPVFSFQSTNNLPTATATNGIETLTATRMSTTSTTNLMNILITTTTTIPTTTTTTTTTTAAPSFNSQTTTTTSATAGTTTNTRIGDDTSRAERIAGGVTPTSGNIFDDFLNWLSNLFGASAKAEDAGASYVTGKVSLDDISNYFWNWWNNLFPAQVTVKTIFIPLTQGEMVGNTLSNERYGDIQVSTHSSLREGVESFETSLENNLRERQLPLMEDYAIIGRYIPTNEIFIIDMGEIMLRATSAGRIHFDYAPSHIYSILQKIGYDPSKFVLFGDLHNHPSKPAVLTGADEMGAFQNANYFSYDKIMVVYSNANRDFIIKRISPEDFQRINDAIQNGLTKENIPLVGKDISFSSAEKFILNAQVKVSSTVASIEKSSAPTGTETSLDDEIPGFKVVLPSEVDSIKLYDVLAKAQIEISGTDNLPSNPDIQRKQEIISQLFSSKYTRVAIDESGNPIGYTRVEIIDSGVALLAESYVLPEWRSQGVRTALFEQSTAALMQDGIKEIRAVVVNYPGSQGSQTLLEQQGFQKISQDENWIKYRLTLASGNLPATGTISGEIKPSTHMFEDYILQQMNQGKTFSQALDAMANDQNFLRKAQDFVTNYPELDVVGNLDPSVDPSVDPRIQSVRNSFVRMITEMGISQDKIDLVKNLPITNQNDPLGGTGANVKQFIFSRYAVIRFARSLPGGFNDVNYQQALVTYMGHEFGHTLFAPGQPVSYAEAFAESWAKRFNKYLGLDYTPYKNIFSAEKSFYDQVGSLYSQPNSDVLNSFLEKMPQPLKTYFGLIKRSDYSTFVVNGQDLAKINQIYNKLPDFQVEQLAGLQQGTFSKTLPSETSVTNRPTTGTISGTQNQKVLFGISHSGDQELEQLVETIKQYSPKKIALELPEDYLQRQQDGIRIFFFSDLADFLKSNGIEVVPLEDPEIWNNQQALDIALSVRQGKVNEMAVRQDYVYYALNLQQMPAYTAPETTPEGYVALKSSVDKLRATLDILDKAKTLDQVMALWEQSNADREAHILQNILKEKPDMIIVGFNHADKLTSSLPDYKYIKFYGTLPNGQSSSTVPQTESEAAILDGEDKPFIGMSIVSIEEYMLNEYERGITPQQSFQDILNDKQFLSDFDNFLANAQNTLNSRGNDIESLVLKAKSDFIDYLQRAGASQEVIAKLKNVQMEFTDTPISAPLEGKISLSKATIVRIALSMNGDFETNLKAVANLNTAHELAHKIRTTNDNVADEQFAEGLGIAFAKSKGYDVSQVTSIHELQLNFFNSFGTGFIFGSSYSDFLQKLPSRIGNYELYIRPALYTADFKTKIPIVSGYANPLSTAEIEPLIGLTKGSLTTAQKTGTDIFSDLGQKWNDFWAWVLGMQKESPQQAATQPSAEAAAGPETPEQSGARYANNAASMQAQQGAEKNQLRPGFDPAKPRGVAEGEILLTDIVQLMISQRQSGGANAAATGTPIANLVSLGLSQVNNVKLQQMAQMTAILQHAMVVKANLLFASSADQLSRNLDLSADYRVDMWQLYDTIAGMGLAPADAQRLQVGVMSNLDSGNLENLLPNDAKGNIDRNWANSAQETARQIEEENFGRPVSAYASGNQISSSTHWTTETQNKGVIGFFSFNDKYTTYTSDGKNVVKVTLDRQTLNQLEKTSLSLEGAAADMEKVSKELEAARAFDAKKLEISVDNSGKTSMVGEGSSTDPNDAIWKKQGLENLKSDMTVPENLAKEFKLKEIYSGKDAVVSFENGKLTSETVSKFDPAIADKLNLGKEWEMSVNFDVKSNTADVTAKNSATGEVKRFQLDENGKVKNAVSENPATGEKLQASVDPEGNIQGQGINEKLSLKSGVTVTGDKVTVQDFSGTEPVKLEFNLQSFTKAEFGKLITDAIGSGKELNAVAVVKDVVTGKPTTVEISINKEGGLTLTREGTKALLSREQALEFAKNEIPDNVKAAVIESGKFRVGVFDIAFDVIAIVSFAFQVTNVLTGQMQLGVSTPQQFQNTVSFGIGAAFAAAATAHVASIIMAESVTLTLGAGSLLGPVGLALMAGAIVATEAAPFAFANNQLTGNPFVSPTGMNLAAQTINSMKISFSGQTNLLANNIVFGQMYQNEFSTISTQVGGVKTTTTPGHYVNIGKGLVAFVPESTSSNQESISTDAYISASSKFLLTPVKTINAAIHGGPPGGIVVQTTGDLVNELYSATSAQQKQAIAAQLASIRGTTPAMELLSALLHNSAQAQQLEQDLTAAQNTPSTGGKGGTAFSHALTAGVLQYKLGQTQASFEADQQAYTDALIKQLGGTRTGENTFTFTENGNTFSGRIDPTTGTVTKELTGFTDKNGVDWTKVSPDTWTTSDGRTYKVTPAHLLSKAIAQNEDLIANQGPVIAPSETKLVSFTANGHTYTAQPDGTWKDEQGNIFVLDAKGNLMEPSFTDSSGRVWNLNTQTGQYESTWTDQGVTYTGTYDPATQTATIIGGGTTTVIDYKTNTVTTTFTDKTGHIVTQKSQSFGKVVVTATTAWVGGTSTTAGHYGTTTTVTIPGGTDENGNPTGFTGTVKTYTVNPDGSVSVTGYAGDLGQLAQMDLSSNTEGTVTVSKTTYDGTNYGEIYSNGKLIMGCSGCSNVKIDSSGHVTFVDKSGTTKNGYDLGGGAYVGEVANPTGANDYYGKGVLCSGGSCVWCSAQCMSYRLTQLQSKLLSQGWTCGGGPCDEDQVPDTPPKPKECVGASCPKPVKPCVGSSCPKPKPCTGKSCPPQVNAVTTSETISNFIDNLISQFFQLIFGSNVPGSVAGSIVPSRTLSQDQIQNLADSQKTNFSSFIPPDQIVATTQP